MSAIHPRNTLTDLAEFRRRKAAEREAAARNTLISSKVRPGQEMDSRVATEVSGTKNDVSPPEETRAEPVDSPSRLQNISLWLYSTVMPDFLLRGAYDPTQTSAPGNELEDADSNNDLSDEENEILMEDSKAASWVPRWMQSHYLWWFMAWLCGFAFAIRFRWGAVYFALSVLVLIWKGLSDSRQRKRGAPSAYSVFNPNCERIEGTLDAEQLQRQMFLRF